MGERSIKFGDKKINKSNSYNNMKAFQINNIDLNKILIPENLSKIKII